MSVGSGPVVGFVAAVYTFVYSVAPTILEAAVFWQLCLDHLQNGYTIWRLPLGRFGFPF